MNSSPTFLQSLNNAVHGFFHVMRHERNMRIHFLFAFFILVAAVFMGVARVEWILLCLSITFVLATEMINTAVENTLDLISPQMHPAVKIIKDISAGMVMMAALNALVVGFLIFSNYGAKPFELLAFRLRNGHWHLTFICLLIVMFFVILAKLYLKKGTPFRGGPISGHSAVAFALWTTLVCTQRSTFVVGVGFCLALLVGQSRLRSKIHSFWEVASGAAVGTLITLLLFQIFS